MSIVKTPLFLFVTGLLVVTNSFLWPRRNETGTLYVHYPTAIFLNLIFIFSFTCLLLNKSRIIRVSSEILLFSALFMDVAYLRITGSSFGYYDALNMFNNVHYAGPAASSFSNDFIWAFVCTSVCFAGIRMLQRNTARNILSKYTALPLVGLCSFFLYAFLFNKDMDVLPAPYRTPISLALAALQTHQPAQPRQAVSIMPDCPQVKHLFLVVDESIAGTALSINGADAEQMPFLKQHQDSLINFGLATSFTNYSAGSNICLISGMRMQQLPDAGQQALHQTSVFQYAKRAGYKTYFIDAQTSGGQLQNFLTPYDRNAIDSFLQPADCWPDLAIYKRDSVVAQLLVALAKKNEKSFVYVNKMGAHWPYAKSYPPALENRHGGLKKLEQEYKLAVQWSVDGFWKQLLSGVTQSDSSIFIYTSDHGEFIDENGYTAAGHGTLYHPNPQEGTVPLIVYDRSGLPHCFKCTKNEAAHEQIFPTALLLMGYNQQFVFSRYGASLFQERENGKRWFLSGDVFGRSRTYKTYLDP